jgi:hypothetical protein
LLASPGSFIGGREQGLRNFSEKWKTYGKKSEIGGAGKLSAGRKLPLLALAVGRRER